MKVKNIIPIITFLIFLLLPGCERGDMFDLAEGASKGLYGSYDISGTLNFPSVLSGYVVVILDVDYDGGNGNEVQMISGDAVSTDNYHYEIKDAPGGTYYLYSVLFIGKSTNNPPTGEPVDNQDYIAFYGCSLGNNDYG